MPLSSYSRGTKRRGRRLGSRWVRLLPAKTRKGGLSRQEGVRPKGAGGRNLHERATREHGRRSAKAQEEKTKRGRVRLPSKKLADSSCLFCLVPFSRPTPLAPRRQHLPLSLLPSLGSMRSTLRAPRMRYVSLAQPGCSFSVIFFFLLWKGSQTRRKQPENKKNDKIENERDSTARHPRSYTNTNSGTHTLGPDQPSGETSNDTKKCGLGKRMPVRLRFIVVVLCVVAVLALSSLHKRRGAAPPLPLLDREVNKGSGGAAVPARRTLKKHAAHYRSVHASSCELHNTAFQSALVHLFVFFWKGTASLAHSLHINPGTKKKKKAWLRRPPPPVQMPLLVGAA